MARSLGEIYSAVLSVERLKQVGLLLRFGAAGIVNTLISLAIVLSLEFGARLESHWANAAGYAAGFVSSYFLSRGFVFRSGGSHVSTGWRFVIGIAVCFAINQFVLTGVEYLAGSSTMARGFSQVVAMGVYSVSFFVIGRYWIFPAARAR
jgi:putative flippase GtrA